MYLLANVSKKVSVVKVESVHPLDESIRFWDERIQDWTYLWPEDFVLVPPDSVETAIAIDTESKPEPQFLDSVSYQLRLRRNDILKEGQECNEDKLCLNV
jgi:hypothetical protein